MHFLIMQVLAGTIHTIKQHMVTGSLEAMRSNIKYYN